MEFQRDPGKSMEIYGNQRVSMQAHGIPYNSTVMHGIPWKSKDAHGYHSLEVHDCNSADAKFQIDV